VSETFAARLNRLFDTVYPPGRGPHTSGELVASLNAHGMRISAPYISQLRTGTRTHPSEATMEAIASFFRVSPAFFSDQYYFRLIDQELTLLAAIREHGVRRVAARVIGLSPGAVDEIAARVEELRRKEHLDRDDRRSGPESNV
jgi:transcriptional regulator with XRE-family HTH domain